MARQETLPQEMRAVHIARPGGPEVLEPVTLPVPAARNGEVLVKVAAAGVNRPDVVQRLGKYPPPPDADPLPGLEIAGEVAALGEGASRYRPGDRVMALVHGGGYAEYCRVHETHCLPVPAGLSAVVAAAVPETYFTVHYNLFMRAGLAAGETLLVHGGAGGIGTTAIQLAVANGATVVTTAGTDEKCRFCERLGAAHAINYRAGDWAEAVRSRLGGRGVDVVLDMVGGSYVQQNIDLLERDGRYVIIAFLKGSKAALDLRAVLSRRLTVTGSLLRPQTIEEKSAIREDLEQRVLPLLEAGTVAPVIDSTFPLEQASRAHARLESGGHIGKIVLEPDHAG